MIIHAYHGHILEGYFGPARSRLYRTLERGLGLISDRLIGVSQATVNDLVRLKVAPREKFEVIPIGLDLSAFEALDPEPGGPLPGGLSPNGEVVFGWVGRMAPIKRVDVLIRRLAHARSTGAPVRLALVGDGELRPELEALARELGVDDSISWLDYRTDVATVIAGCDAVALRSDNEGTPVSLIEAGAAARPVVSTDVGGVAEVVPDQAGSLVAANDHSALVDAMAGIARTGSEHRREFGAAGRENALRRNGVRRLVNDIDGLYCRLAPSIRQWSPDFCR